MLTSVKQETEHNTRQKDPHGTELTGCPLLVVITLGLVMEDGRTLVVMATIFGWPEFPFRGMVLMMGVLA